MTQNRSHARLISFTISAMFTSAFLATAPNTFVAAAAGPQLPQIINVVGMFPGMQTPEVAPPPITPDASDAAISPPPRLITAAQFKKILDDTAVNGKIAPVSTEVTTPLGLTIKGNTLTVPRDSFRDPNENRHSFWKLENKNYLFGVSNQVSAHIYYVDKDFVLIAAVTRTAKDGVSIIPNSDAHAGLCAELAYFECRRAVLLGPMFEVRDPPPHRMARVDECASDQYRPVLSP